VLATRTFIAERNFRRIEPLQKVATMFRDFEGLLLCESFPPKEHSTVTNDAKLFEKMQETIGRKRPDD
jgi:hypothetical protein